MDGEKSNEKNSDHKKRMVRVPSISICPGNEFLHQSRSIERRGRLKNDADTPALRVECLHVVDERFVIPAMVFIAWRDLEQVREAASMVFGQRNIPPRIEHHFRRFGVSRNLLFIPCPKGSEIQVRKKRSTSLSDSRAPSMRVDAPTDSTVAIRRRVARRSGARLPKAFHAPLNSSISPISRNRSGVITRFLNGAAAYPKVYPKIPERDWGSSG